MKDMLEIGIKVRYEGSNGILDGRKRYTVIKSTMEQSKMWRGQDNMIQLDGVKGSFDADLFMEQYKGKDRFEPSTGCECLGWIDHKEEN